MGDRSSRAHLGVRGREQRRIYQPDY